MFYLETPMNFLSQATEEYSHAIPELLPHAKVYQIQVGSKLFKLSGASLSSDGPSYFTNYFQQPGNGDKTLFIDRSPAVFEIINNHLQGYYVVLDEIDDQTQMYLISDAVYYSLKRLLQVITKDYFHVRVGNKSFKIPKQLITTPGNHPNFFTINNRADFGGVEVIEKHKFLRPPPSKCLEVDLRSASLFSDLMEALRGNLEVVRDENHRRLLIRECRYYRFLGLEQMLVNYKIIYNPYTPEIESIVININDIVPKGIHVPSARQDHEVIIQYQRPYVPRELHRDLVFQIDLAPGVHDATAHSLHDVRLLLNKYSKLMLVRFSGRIAVKMKQLFLQVIKPDEWISIDSGLTNDNFVFIVTMIDAHCVINGLEMKNTWVHDFLGVSPTKLAEIFNTAEIKDGAVIVPGDEGPPNKRRRTEPEVEGDIFEFRLKRSQWKMSFLNGHVKMICMKIDGVSDNFLFNKKEEFL